MKAKLPLPFLVIAGLNFSFLVAYAIGARQGDATAPVTTMAQATISPEPAVETAPATEAAAPAPAEEATAPVEKKEETATPEEKQGGRDGKEVVDYKDAKDYKDYKDSKDGKYLPPVKEFTEAINPGSSPQFPNPEFLPREESSRDRQVVLPPNQPNLLPPAVSPDSIGD